jgi:Fe-S oxidoreductase
MTSFSPAISGIAEANMNLLYEIKEDFAVLGEREVCCGFPLIVAGLSQEWQEFREKNIETIRSMSAKKIVFNCASCYHTFCHEYQEFLPDVEFLHNTEYIQRLILDGKVELKGLSAKITYHDPCDLGRGCKVFEPPREIIKQIPEADFIELPNNRNLSTCCGGGGDLEMIDADLVNKIANNLLEEIEETGADIVTTACGQCKRMLQNAVKDRKSKIEVKDIAELMLSAGIERR